MAAQHRLIQLSIALCLAATVLSQGCCGGGCPRPPIPNVPCPNKPGPCDCRGPPCIPDCCPGANRNPCGCKRKKRSAEPQAATETRPLREIATIDFGSFIDKVVATAPVQDPICNSERLRAVLEQSISENTTRSVENILERIHDTQFVAKCTFNGSPDLDRRVSFCQLTKGNTTCAVATGLVLQPPSHAISLNVSEFFRPEMKIVDDGPTPPPRTPPPVVLPVIIPTLLSSSGPVPPPLFKHRGEGFVAF